MLKYLQKNQFLNAFENFFLSNAPKFTKTLYEYFALEVIRELKCQKIILKDLYSAIKFDKVSSTFEIFKNLMKIAAVNVNPKANLLKITIVFDSVVELKI